MSQYIQAARTELSPINPVAALVSVSWPQRMFDESRACTPLRNNLLTRFYAICKKAGIADACRGGAVDIHSLRVTFTTMAIDCGASVKAVQSILRHSSPDLTLSIYTKDTDRSKRDAINALPFAGSSSPTHLIPVPNAHK